LKLNHIRIPDPSDITLIGETEYLRQAMVRIEEALNNIEKHARATEVRVRFYAEDGAIAMRIEDNGRGFDVACEPPGRPGMGLKNMRERAALVHGVLSVRSAPGTGTTLTVNIPFHRQTGEDDG